MKKRHLAAVLASLVAVSAMSVSIPKVSADAEKYTGLITEDGTSDPSGNLNKRTLENVTRADGKTDPLVTYNATEFKKVLEIEDTANIPAVTFEYKVEGMAADIAADPTNNTLAVLKGPNPVEIEYKLENVDSNAFVVDDNKKNYSTTNITKTTNGFTLTYSEQNVVPASGKIDSSVADAAQAGGSSLKSVDDNVLINNVNIADGLAGVDTYYAIKTVQMDFSNCGFTEPGIYRYYITESGVNQGVSNDYSVTGDNNCKRTIDVYVEDATYTTAGETPATKNKLKIAGYVMYQGHVTTGPKSGAATDENPTEKTMEDGLAHTNPSGNGGANGLEVASAVKSEGIRNIYKTNDITFGKTVTGNQASKDKFFKFTITLDDEADSQSEKKNVGDDDVFAVTGDWEKTVTAASNDMATPNAATLYTAAVISNASNTSVAGTAGESDHGNNVIWLTGKQLKAGYSFYLQNNDYISIHGLPENIGYTLVEDQEDYVPSASLLNGELTNDITHNRTVTGTFDGDGTFTAKNTDGFAQVIDTKIQNDVDIQLTNTREGFIPTGVILSVAAPSAVGLLAIGGVIYLAVKRRKDEDEE